MSTEAVCHNCVFALKDPERGARMCSKDQSSIYDTYTCDDFEPNANQPKEPTMPKMIYTLAKSECALEMHVHYIDPRHCFRGNYITYNGFDVRVTNHNDPYLNTSGAGLTESMYPGTRRFESNEERDTYASLLEDTLRHWTDNADCWKPQPEPTDIPEGATVLE